MVGFGVTPAIYAHGGGDAKPVAAARPSVAGGRVRLPHQLERLDPAVRRDLLDHEAADGFPLSGVLYQPARDPEVVVVAMHPRVDFTRHYLAPALVGAGYAFCGANT